MLKVKLPSNLILVLSGIVAAQPAGASQYVGTLTNVTDTYGDSDVAVLTGTVTDGWIYDDSLNTLTAPGIFNAIFPYHSSLIWNTETIEGLVLSTNGGMAAATSFTCTEGTMGFFVNVNVCGNYELGDNSLDESTTTWGPGLAYSRVLGGDDTAINYNPLNPLPRNLAWYDGMQVTSFSGGVLNIATANDNPNVTIGYSFTVSNLQPVPAPHAIWLLGSAVGLLGAIRRKMSA